MTLPKPSMAPVTIIVFVLPGVAVGDDAGGTGPSDESPPPPPPHAATSTAIAAGRNNRELMNFISHLWNARH
jgi:hypothetical protein